MVSASSDFVYDFDVSNADNVFVASRTGFTLKIHKFNAIRNEWIDYNFPIKSNSQSGTRFVYDVRIAIADNCRPVVAFLDQQSVLSVNDTPISTMVFEYQSPGEWVRSYLGKHKRHPILMV